MYVFGIRNTRTVRLLTHIFFKDISHTTANMSSQVLLRVLPSSKCLFNEPIWIKVEGLVPGQSVELRARLRDDKCVTFKSSGTYKADPRGEIRLDNDPSLGGSYSGVAPMGLFWSMRPETPHVKLRKKDVLSPCLVDIEVHDSERQGHVLARETNQRGFMVEGLRRIPVKEGRIRGILFLPPGPGPFPGIVHMHTLGGGLSEVTGSLLANQGFVVLSLAFYGYEDLPKKIKKFDLEYFEEAILLLRNVPEVKAPGVGILSISKSGDLALSMASFLTGVSATVCVNGCNANTMIPLHYRGMVIPPLLSDPNKARVAESGVLDISDALLDPRAPENQGSLIPIERAKCKFLFAVSGDDRNWKSCSYAEQMMKRLKDNGKDDAEVVVYPKAGHFLEVPYMPHCATGMHAAAGNAVVAFGGDPSAHAEAQVDLWNRIPAFFRKHLDSNNDHNSKL
ncbi:acyl-coenzyme A thioesterase 1 [Conger conger]|uniref:acyl-coenzyme A thioesterase 1 n=1 Tax=Conger conger TaxID=82655 RepID=UPI002A5ADBE0|nr:acyl-coenzyme A thioesterase 1 [Conger conger]